MSETNQKLTAYEVQQMLGVEDFVNIAYGYTLARQTVEIYFEDNKLVRLDMVGDHYIGAKTYARSPYFEYGFFSDSIKRFYRKKTDEKLIALFNTFGPGLSLVD